MIVVFTPCGSSLATCTHLDLLALQIEMAHETVQGPVMGSMHPDQLIHAIDQARGVLGATHVGFVEHDMRFPSDAFRQLKARDVSIVGATYRQRQKNQWTAIKDDTADCNCLGKTGMERVMSVGLGVVLINLAVFDNLPQPWFSNPWVQSHRRHMGVDCYFGRHAKSHGIESYVDHDLSQQVGHIAGDIELWPDHLRFTQTGQRVAC